MYKKRLWPYIAELIIFLFVVGVLSCFVFSGNITVKYAPELALFAFVLVLWLIKYIFTFIVLSLSATIDALTDNYNTVTAEFIEQFVFKSSPFLTKRVDKNNTQSKESIYFKIVVKNNENIIIFTSSEYFDLKPNASYQFVLGRRSNAIVDVIPTIDCY